MLPPFIDLPSPNYFIDFSQIHAVILHGTSGPLQASLDWLRNPQPDNPDARVSANFLISKAGVAYCLVNPFRGRRAWANGVVEFPDLSLKWLAAAITAKVNPNRITVSIEHEASKIEMERRSSMTDAQFNTSIDLTASILKWAGLKASHQTVAGHNQLSGHQKYNCPGVIFPPAYTEILLDRYKDLAE